MAKYITRVRLQDAEQNDFIRFDSEMKKEAFVRINKSKPAKENNVIAGEYNRQGNITMQDVTDAVYRAASRTGKKYSFTIIREKAAFSNSN
ncbi:MAG TPA: hypothetical protein VK563_23940 [Puia sp.]|nr:hypothetical protein [Puia sp.]